MKTQAGGGDDTAASVLVIDRIDGGLSHEDLAALADILVACVAGGASVSFMAGLDHDRAQVFWRAMAGDAARGGRVLLVARPQAGAAPVGTIQLVPAMTENQPHRSDIAKLLVHPRARRQGIAGRLLAAAEAASLAMGRRLITLDTDALSNAARFYPAHGYQTTGIVPGYALMPDGAPCDTLFLWKWLEAATDDPAKATGEKDS